MTDRFKFRVWDNEKNRMDDDLYYEPGDLQVACINEVFKEYLDDKRYIVEQCTGLKDKNGKLIYEGDLIKSPSNSHLLKVVWENGAWQTIEYRKGGKHEQLLYCLVRCYGVDLVSNIHENKDLLEG